MLNKIVSLFANVHVCISVSLYSTSDKSRVSFRRLRIRVIDNNRKIRRR